MAQKKKSTKQKKNITQIKKTLSEEQKAKQKKYSKKYYLTHRDKLIKYQKEHNQNKSDKPIKHRAPKRVGLNRYWDEDKVSEALVKYNQTETPEEREKIYIEILQKPFEKLVENIFNTFKFSYFEGGPVEAQKECLGHLITAFNKFNTEKGKAFSYFSLVAKNWFIAENNKNYKRFNTHTTMNLEPETPESNHLERQLMKEDENFKDFKIQEYCQMIVNWWDKKIDGIFPKERDNIIAKAVIELMRRSDIIDAYNKKLLYLYIREICNCKTQWISKVVNRMKPYNEKLRKQYINDGFISC